jgi:hypothetical protein
LALALSVSLGIPYHDEAKRMGQLIRILKGINPGVSTNVELAITLPQLSKISWDEVWELRSSKYIDKFRVFLQSSIPTGTPEQEIMAKINEALWHVIGKSTPSPSGSIVSRAIGTIPLPLGLPNPLALYRDIRDGAQERSLYMNYGWLFFMQEVRTRAAKP